MDESVRHLTQAQIEHYKSLIAHRGLVNAEIQRFVQYLSEEHSVTGDGWTLHHDRFERDSLEGTSPVEAQAKDA